MALPPLQTREFVDRIIALEDECRGEIDLAAQSLHEIALMLAKTNSEAEKVANRELQLANRVRDMEMHLDNYGREDIRDLYTSSHELQLRLYMMRSQAEQLQARQQHIKEYQEKLRLLLDLLSLQLRQSDGPVASGVAAGTTSIGESHAETAAGPTISTIIEAQEDERHRIARQIHDGPTQALTNLILRAEICERLIDRDVAEARAELGGLKAMINASLQDTRRLIFDLRPMILDDLGLVPTLRRYLTELSRLKQLQGQVAGPEHDIRLTTTMQVALFRFVQTILAFLLADGPVEHVDVHVERLEQSVRLRFDATAIQIERAQIDERLRDPHLQHRLTLLNATLKSEVRSHRGVTIEIAVPVPPDADTFSE